MAKIPEVTHYQAYAGLSAPITFNGLVRRYYLRRGGEVGDLQVNLVDKHARKRKSHEIAQAVRPALEAIAKRHGADVKVVEVPPGPPVLSPIVAEIYGPDVEAQMALAKQVRRVFETTPDITAIDDTVLDPAERVVLRVDTAKAAQYGIPAVEVARSARLALAGEDIQRDQPDLIRAAGRLLNQGGTLIFSPNFRRFRLDQEGLPDFAIDDITRSTIPKDFERNPRIHQCFKITRRR